jgi:predicted GNAT family acetyltransferase
MLSSPDIEGVAIGKERSSSQLLYQFNHRGGIVWSQESQIARFTEMDLDGSKLVIEVDGLNSCSLDQPGELMQA